tara:strand:- start:430 stop:729 length:300 start_codon:yes stop_codon:yes gene_type:complete
MQNSVLIKLKKEIEEYLIRNKFVKETDFCNDSVFTYDLKATEQDLFRVSVFSESEFISVDIYLVSVLGKYIIARRYEVKNLNQFKFLIEKTSRSPLFKI